MAYINKNWITGDVITPSALNNIENGIVSNESSINSIDAEIDTINTSLNSCIYRETYNGEIVDISQPNFITSISILNIEKVTQSQYDALPSAKTTNNTLYLVIG